MKLCVLSLSWNNSVHMYTCTFIHLYCKINFTRQLSTRYLINLPFFSTGILQLGHGLVVFLIVSLDASSHRACVAACSSTMYPCKERQKPPAAQYRKAALGHDVYAEVVTIYPQETDRSDCKARWAGLCERCSIFALKCKLIFSQYARDMYWVRSRAVGWWGEHVPSWGSFLPPAAAQAASSPLLPARSGGQSPGRTTRGIKLCCKSTDR